MRFVGGRSLRWRGRWRVYEAGGFALDEIETIEVHTFHEGGRGWGVKRPRTTEEAQYSLPFPGGGGFGAWAAGAGGGLVGRGWEIRPCWIWQSGLC